MNGAEGLPDGERLSNLFNAIGLWVGLEIVLILLAAWALIQLAQRALPRVAEYLPAPLRLYTLNAVPLLRLFLIVAAVAWIVPLVFDVTLQNFVLIFGTVSVALGFAFKDLASSTLAGVVALFERPYRAGDWVRIGEHYGEVIHVGMRAVQLQTAADDTVTVPHLRMWTDNVANANNGEGTCMCIAEFHTVPQDDTRPLTDALTAVARTSPYLAWDRPVLVITRNTPYGALIQLKAYPFELRHQFLFTSDLSQRGRMAIEALGLRQVQMPDLDTGAAPVVA